MQAMNGLAGRVDACFGGFGVLHVQAERRNARMRTTLGTRYWTDPTTVSSLNVFTNPKGEPLS